MLSSKRKIKKKTGLFLAFIFTTSFSAFAGQDINLTANVKIALARAVSAIREI
ncbi:Fimbrial protein YadK [Escherichia coli]|nr:Fimbrial protein YadK [Escherichia coli]